ncbi:hypothetical protein [Paenibacillus paridis]|uniref:hypothetical protein n=1 Tax=Paenibacillus paridis TaxID=2583376 RepID=UPI00111F39BD|nr:hypothetical protein [Paenibacillus paridis]
MVWIWLLGIIGLFVSLYLLYRKRQEEETGLYYKLLGFSFLGAFYMTLDHWKIPLGFVLCLFLVAWVKFPYYAFSSKGDGFTTYAIKDSEKYAIEEDRVVAITNEQLPVTGFWLRVNGLNDNGAMDANGQADFFFDYRFDPEIEPQ